MEKLTEGAFKSLAHDKGYFYDGKMWVHHISGHRLSDDGMAHYLSRGVMPSTPVEKEPEHTRGIPTKELINKVIQRKLKAARSWKPGGEDDPDMRKPGQESERFMEGRE